MLCRRTSSARATGSRARRPCSRPERGAIVTKLESVRAQIPEEARDIRLNLQAVLQSGGALSDGERWGTALAAAIASRSGGLADAIAADARAAGVGEEFLADARAAAALMAMNNVYYRFRHLVGKE